MGERASMHLSPGAVKLHCFRVRIGYSARVLLGGANLTLAIVSFLILARDNAIRNALAVQFVFCCPDTFLMELILMFDILIGFYLAAGWRALPGCDLMSRVSPIRSVQFLDRYCARFRWEKGFLFCFLTLWPPLVHKIHRLAQMPTVNIAPQTNSVKSINFFASNVSSARFLIALFTRQRSKKYRRNYPTFLMLTICRRMYYILFYLFVALSNVEC